MRTDQAATIHRLDYTPPDFLVDRVALVFDLLPDDTRVDSTLSLRRNPVADPRAPLILDGEDLTLETLWLDGVALDPGRWRMVDGRLVVERVPDAFALRAITRLSPASNSTLSGLYVSNDNFFTQCEAQGFRRITFFPDRPDVMARYTVTLRAPRDGYPMLLSNGNLVAEGDCPAPEGLEGAGGAAWHQAVWDDPFPKPSYLFALVAGNLDVTEEHLRTRSGRDVLLQVWAEPGNEDRTGHALQSLVRAIRWDEERFGLELDLDRYMIVAVSDFNMGAMENKGLNIFNTKYVFAHPSIATDQDFAGVESVVGHEYFHNWTGNRVTCRDWFQLTLKEGLTVFRDQEFSADVLAAQAATPAAAASARAVKRIEDVRVLRATQFPEDAGPMAHPIRPDSYQEINNFYTVTVYEKGAEVIRMLQTLTGREGFRRGMDLYFERHDGQAVTCDDFVAAIADANRIDLSQFRRWYSQAGTPRLAIAGSFDTDAGRYRVEVKQFCPATPGQPGKEPFHIPLAIGLVGPDGADLPLHPAPATAEHVRRVETAGGQQTAVLDVTEAQQVFEFDGLAQAPVPSLARNFSAPVVVDYPYDDAQLAFLAAHDSDPFNRWEAAQRLTIECALAVLDCSYTARRCAPLVSAMARVLDDAQLDPAYVEQLFVLPSEGFIAEQLPVIDPLGVRRARDAVRNELARALAPRWQEHFVSLGAHPSASTDARAAGERALKNLALGFWVDTGNPAAVAAASEQFDRSANMTDRSGALQALMRAGGEPRERGLAEFERMFADEPLVMDKWFALQATMHRRAGDPPVLERVRRLTAHPAFSLRNPNRVRALIGSFCHGNLAEFHTPDGAGYTWWAEHVLELDPLNPQVAARLARALDRWRKFPLEYQAAMRAALETVAAAPRLSRDVREIVTKALGA